ncbi:MAG: hypothetical protein GX347_02720 [Epulopiscium sp.]|nr:hypothetical protein [Candidatus Epulonipiscium sp.]
MIPRNIYLIFETITGKELGGYPLTTLPIKEEQIIKKSIEIFADSNPCNFHRNAVKQRIYLEISRYFIQCYQQGDKKVLWEDIPMNIREYLDMKQKIEKVFIYYKG